MKKFEGKVAVITGGSRDIGRATSVAFANEGASVVINYNSNEAAARDTLSEITNSGGNAIIVRGDMTVPADVDQLVNATREAFGDAIHYLVNVVGGMVERRPLDAMDYDFFEYVMRLNVTSTFLTTKAVVPHMPAGGAAVLGDFVLHRLQLLGLAADQHHLRSQRGQFVRGTATDAGAAASDHHHLAGHQAAGEYRTICHAEPRKTTTTS